MGSVFSSVVVANQYGFFFSDSTRARPAGEKFARKDDSRFFGSKWGVSSMVRIAVRVAPDGCAACTTQGVVIARREKPSCCAILQVG